MRGKAWDIDEVRRLQQLVEEGNSVDAICKIMVKTHDSIEQKMYDLKLKPLKEEEANKKIFSVSSSRPLKIPKELPSIEANLKDMVAAMDALKKGGFDKLELMRLSKVVANCRAYNREFASYLNYRELEERLFEVEAKYANLVKRKKSQNNATS
jgi:hypothetical protein